VGDGDAIAVRLSVGRVSSFIALVFLGLIAFGCERAEDPIPTSPPRRATSAAPVDTTLPGELAEGEHVAFGLRAPRRMRLKVRFPDAVYVVGPVPFEAATNYVRERVQDGTVETGPTRTVFDNATVKAAPDRTVRVEVTSRHGAVEIVVRDRTPRPVLDPSLPDAERWRQGGLHPDGRVIEERAE